MKTITLKHPFTNAEGKEIKTLTVKSLKRKDLKASVKHSSDQIEQEDFLFALSTGLTIEDIEELHVADSNQLSEAFREMGSA